MKIFAGYLLIINLAAFAAMGIDKRRAVKNMWRIRERTLFLLAIAGGSIGGLVGMYVFHHKTKHLRFVIGIPLILCLQLAVFIFGYTLHCRESRQPEHVVEKQLSQIRALDADTIQSFLSYKNLVSDVSLFSGSSRSAEDAVLLFFRDFTYQVTSSSVTQDRAVVTVQITNIDTTALAHDLALELSRQRITAFEEDEVKEIPQPDFYELLSDALARNDYPKRTVQADFHLEPEEGGEWSIVVDDALQDVLSGGFISALSDPYLLSPDEVLALYKEKYSDMSAAQLRSYFRIDDVFSTYSPTYADELDRLYTEKIAEYFDWSSGPFQITGDTASADLTITSIDMPYIMEFYRQALLDYAATTESITDDAAALSDASAKRLLDAISDHARPAQYEVSVLMENDGTGWLLVVDDELSDAFLGGIRDAVAQLQEE